MRIRSYHVFVIGGLIAGIVAAIIIETEPRYIGWLFSVGAGLGGGAFLAAITSGDALAGGGGAPDRPGARTRRGNPVRPAWFDEPHAAPGNDAPDDEPPATPPVPPRNGTH